MLALATNLHNLIGNLVSFIRDHNPLLSGHLHLPGHPGCVGSLLPGHHDLLGPGLWAALDTRLLLLCLDLPCTPGLHGHQVTYSTL